MGFAPTYVASREWAWIATALLSLGCERCAVVLCSRKEDYGLKRLTIQKIALIFYKASWAPAGRKIPTGSRLKLSGNWLHKREDENGNQSVKPDQMAGP